MSAKSTLITGFSNAGHKLVSAEEIAPMLFLCNMICDDGGTIKFIVQAKQLTPTECIFNLRDMTNNQVGTNYVGVFNLSLIIKANWTRLKSAEVADSVASTVIRKIRDSVSSPQEQIPPKNNVKSPAKDLPKKSHTQVLNSLSHKKNDAIFKECVSSDVSYLLSEAYYEYTSKISNRLRLGVIDKIASSVNKNYDIDDAIVPNILHAFYNSSRVNTFSKQQILEGSITFIRKYCEVANQKDILPLVEKLITIKNKTDFSNAFTSFFYPNNK